MIIWTHNVWFTERKRAREKTYIYSDYSNRGEMGTPCVTHRNHRQQHSSNNNEMETRKNCLRYIGCDNNGNCCSNHNDVG